MVWECIPRKCVPQIFWMKSQLRSHLAGCPVSSWQAQQPQRQVTGQ
jgi:hypothetical protein